MQLDQILDMSDTLLVGNFSKRHILMELLGSWVSQVWVPGLD